MIVTLAFSRQDNSSCSGNVIQQFNSIHDAYNACKRDDKCQGIVDAGCDNFIFWTCGGKIEPDPNKLPKTSCAWEKGKSYNFITQSRVVYVRWWISVYSTIHFSILML